MANPAHLVRPARTLDPARRLRLDSHRSAIAPSDPDHLAQQDPRDHPDHLARPDRTAVMVTRLPMDHPDHQDHQAQLARPARRDHQERMVSFSQLALFRQAHLELPAKTEHPAHPVTLARLATPAPMASPVTRDHLEMRARPVPRARMVPRDHPVHQDPRVAATTAHLLVLRQAIKHTLLESPLPRYSYSSLLSCVISVI